LRGTCVF